MLLGNQFHLGGLCLNLYHGKNGLLFRKIGMLKRQREEEPEIIKTEHPKIDLLAKIDDGKNSDNKSVEPVAEEVPMETDLDKQEMNSGSEFSGTPQMEKPLLKQSCGDAEEVSSVKSKKKSAFSSLKSSVYRKTSKVPVPSSPAKPITSHMKKENHAATTTPVATKKSVVELTEKRKSTPKFLRTYVNSMPTKEPDKLSATATRTKENPKRSQDCKTPLKTPRMAPSAWMSKLAPATPVSENTRPKSPNDGSKTTGPTPRWHILSAVCSKSLTACRNKLQSPTLSSTPFTLRTEERAARRKQASHLHRFLFSIQSASSLYHEISSLIMCQFVPNMYRNLRRNSMPRRRKQAPNSENCVKASVSKLAHFPTSTKRGGKQLKSRQKSSVTQPQSPKLGKKPNSRTIPLPSSISKYKSSNISKHVFNKNGQNTNDCFASVPEMINHENTSPNIQY
ncbi:hypothetical protein M9H77_37149 [Catharanthus roseus]|uniref:Uncharacterized protein n=1 Tax=Catharanthus roseus TaxID=4058 RepID=A0ACB9ZUV8_CATRO|nr:hypothetical protein M9H77_37149 [Catharanthus roseus]